MVFVSLGRIIVMLTLLVASAIVSALTNCDTDNAPCNIPGAEVDFPAPFGPAIRIRCGIACFFLQYSVQYAVHHTSESGGAKLTRQRRLKTVACP